MVKRKPANKKRGKKSVDSIWLGYEPEWGEEILTDEQTRKKIMDAYNWYNYYYSFADAKKWFLELLKLKNVSDDKIDIISSVPDSKIGTTVGWLSRMIINGAKVRDSNKEFIKNKIKDLYVLGKKIQEQETKLEAVVVKPMTPIQKLIRDIINEVDVAIDEFHNDFKSDFSLYTIFEKHDVSTIVASEVALKFRSWLKEIKVAMSGKDEDVKEAYNLYSKAELKQFHDFMKMIVGDADKWVVGKKAQRKPRKKKQKKSSSVVTKVKYKESDSDLKVQSVAPENIIGSVLLYLFNTKTRELQEYYSDTGFEVSGTTLKNFDETKSGKKKVRKPEEIINKMVTGGKRDTQNIFKSLKTKRGSVTGRINNDTLILKVFKK